MTNFIGRDRIVKLYFGPFGPAFVDVPTGDNCTKTIYFTDGVTMAYVKLRINQIIADYLVRPIPIPKSTATTPASLSSSIPSNIDENKCNDYLSTNIRIGFAIALLLILLLLLINIFFVIKTKRSKDRSRIENISGESLRLNDIFSDLNHATQRERQPKQQC